MKTKSQGLIFTKMILLIILLITLKIHVGKAQSAQTGEFNIKRLADQTSITSTDCPNFSRKIDHVPKYNNNFLLNL